MNNLNYNELQKLATTSQDHYHSISDRKYIGPGIWYKKHRDAFHARTLEQQQEFARQTHNLASHFPCKDCRQHFLDYLEKNPIEDMFGKTIEIDGDNLHLGVFVWSWIFHNAVNQRLNKPLMEFRSAYNLFAEDQSCHADCETGDLKVAGEMVKEPILRFIR
jgi:hypothetical protein